MDTLITGTKTKSSPFYKITVKMCSGSLLSAALLVCLSNVSPTNQQYPLTYQQQLQQQLQQRYIQQQLQARGLALNRYPYNYPQQLAAAVNPNYLALLGSQFAATPAPGPDPLLASCACATPICQHPIPNNRTYCQSACIAEVIAI